MHMFLHQTDQRTGLGAVSAAINPTLGRGFTFAGPSRTEPAFCVKHKQFPPESTLDLSIR